VITFVSLLALFTTLTLTPPSFDDVRRHWRPSDARVLDRHGEVIHEVRLDERRRRLAWTGLGEISPALVGAVLASEDRRFYGHHGVDPWALTAATWQRVRGGPSRGASTISMQVAALLDPRLHRGGAPRTTAQKWMQMRVAWGLEARWSKAQILEAYLNLVTFRGELQGVAAGAAVLFGKAPHGLDEGEAAVLAVLLRAPNAPEDIVARRAERLLDGRADVVAAAVARASAVARGTGPRVALAPHAAARLVRTREPGAGVVDVPSTLDLAVQHAATAALLRHLADVRERHVDDGAVLVVDNASGDVLAYVGSSGALSAARFVDGVQAPRQAGSSLKPFLYGLALDRKLLTAAALVDDSPLEIPVVGGLYRPHNYDDRFRGLVSVRTALASSLNVPAVRTLGLVGEDAFVAHLQRLGFAGLREAGSFYGPALALGSADVSLWELVTAHRTLATGGRGGALTLAPASPRAGEPLLSPATAFLVADILADRESRSATFGLENALATPFWTAVKTGTSKDMRDNWCVGFSRRYTVGVWVGNFSGEPMWNVSGTTGAAPIWRDLMMWLHRDVPSPAPSAPAELVRARVAFARGTEPGRDDWFIAGTEPATPMTRAAAPAPGIVTPARGTRIAIDPDIPAVHQRVTFEARHAPGEARWILDGIDVGAGTMLLWPPRPGRHALALVDGEGRVRDTTVFDVRGAASAD
jgi:penicillin-binding protein 1C